MIVSNFMCCDNLSLYFCMYVFDGLTLHLIGKLIVSYLLCFGSSTITRVKGELSYFVPYLSMWWSDQCRVLGKNCICLRMLTNILNLIIKVSCYLLYFNCILIYQTTTFCILNLYYHSLSPNNFSSINHIV
jgi:hypothetical protein